MPTFEYEALMPNGTHERGTIFGQSLEAAREDLSRRGYLVQAIQPMAILGDPLLEPPRPASAPPQTQAAEPGVPDDPLLRPRSYVATQVAGPLVGRVPPSQLLFFFRQLSAMLGAGVPYAQTLHTLKGQTNDGRLKRVIEEMKVNVEAGRPASTAMQRYPEVFGPMMVSLFRVGEQTGGLDQSLQQMAQYLEREIELRNLYRRVTFYPKLVLFFAVVIALGTNAIIASLGKQGGLNSPLTQPAVLVVLVPLLIGLFLFFRVGLANPKVRGGFDQFVLLIPYLGKTLHQIAMARFGRAMGALYKAGVPIPEAIRLAADASGNEAVRARIYPAVDRLRDGGTLTPALQQTGAFSPIVMDMMATGESTGNLDLMLNKVAEYYEGESVVRSQQLGHVVGVAVYALVAIYVGYMVISFYSGYLGGVMGAAGE